MSQLRLQSKKLDQLATSASTFHSSVKSELRTTQRLVSEEHRVIVEKVKSEVRALSRQLPEEASILSQLQRHGAEVMPVSISDDKPLDYNEPPPSYLQSLMDSAPASQLLVSCQFFSVKLPLGLLTVRKLFTNTRMEESQYSAGASSQSSSQVEFSLFPVPWLTKTVIHMSFGLKGTTGEGTPDMSWKLKQRHYNNNPNLVKFLNLGNISAIQNMFRKSEASPHDLLAPWGNTLLHVSPTAEAGRGRELIGP
jgi:hypothetical protein